MNNNTIIQTKKEFLEMLNKVIDEDDAILWTRNTGIIEFMKKYNEKRVTFGFAADAFIQNDGVNDLCSTHNRILFSAFICNKSILSEGAKELIP